MPERDALERGATLRPSPTAHADLLWAARTLTGPNLVYVLAERPSLRRRVGEEVLRALAAEGRRGETIELDRPSERPLLDLLEAAEARPHATLLVVHGLGRSLHSNSHRLLALFDLNVRRDQIRKRLHCPLLLCLHPDDEVDLSLEAADFWAWRTDIFRFSEPRDDDERAYRTWLAEKFRRVQLFSTAGDAPISVDLERIALDLSATRSAFPAAARRANLGFRVASDTPPEARFAFSMAAGASCPTMPGMGEPEQTLPPAEQRMRWPMQGDRPPAEDPDEPESARDLSAVLRHIRRLLLVGAPGSGKTTFLRRLTFALALHRAEERFGLDDEVLPLYVPLRELPAPADPDEGLVSQVGAFLAQEGSASPSEVPVTPEWFAALVREGRAVLLLDGLDEVADPRRRRELARALTHFLRDSRYAACRVIVTSRAAGYRGEVRSLLDEELAEWTLCPLSTPQTEQYIHAWYAALGASGVALSRTGTDPRADNLCATLRDSPRLNTLTTNPLLLSLLVLAHQRGLGLPEQRALLYDELTEFALGYWDLTKGGQVAAELSRLGGLTRSEKRILIQPVALWLHERGEAGLEIETEPLLEQLAAECTRALRDGPERARDRARLFLQLATERAGLLVERRPGSYAFAHLTFQEYLAARALADEATCVEDSVAHLHDPWWREVLLLEVGHAGDVRSYGRRARRQTEALVRGFRDAETVLEPVLRRNLLFAAHCLCETGLLSAGEDLRDEIWSAVVSLAEQTSWSRQKNQAKEAIRRGLESAGRLGVARQYLERCLATGDWNSAPLVQQAGAVLADSDEDIQPWLARISRLLAAPEWTMRKTALLILKGMARSSEPALTLLSRGLQDADPHLRWVTLMEFWKLGARGAEYLPQFVALLSDTENGDCAATTIANLGARAAEAVPTLERLLGADVATADNSARALLGLSEILPSARLALLGALEHKHPEVRRRALQALAIETGDLRPHAAALLAALTDLDWEVRRAAVDVLEAAGSRAAFAAPSLISCLRSSEEEVRRTAVDGLAALRTALEPLLPEIIQLLESAEAPVRAVAADLLGRCLKWTPAPVPFLRALISDPDPDSREAAIRALGNARLLLPDELAGFLADPSHAVRRAAASALNALGAAAAPASSALLERLPHTDSSEYGALHQIVQSSHDHAEQYFQDLVTAFAASDGMRRDAILLLLAELPGRRPEVLQIAMHALTEEHEDGYVCATAARLLGSAPEYADEGIPILISLLDRAEGRLREAAAEALRNLGSTVVPFLRMLMELMSSANLDTRIVVAELIRELGPAAAATAGAPLRACLEAPEPAVRCAAVRALSALQVQSADVWGQLRTLLQDNSDLVRIEVVLAIAAQPGPAQEQGVTPAEVAVALERALHSDERLPGKVYELKDRAFEALLQFTQGWEQSGTPHTPKVAAAR